MKNINSMTSDEFFEFLQEMRGITPIERHLCKMLHTIDTHLNDSVIKFLYLLFSLSEDGNTQFSLDAPTLLNKWLIKWNGLLLLKENNPTERSFLDKALKTDFSTIIAEGIEYIKGSSGNLLVERRMDGDLTRDMFQTTKPFVIAKKNGKEFLYATKYFDAKCKIERIGKKFFKKGEKPSKNDLIKCIEETKTEHKRSFNKKTGQYDLPFLINKEQAEAIYRGQKENLIITGGPGTGKTTVVFYILWFLLKNDKKYLEQNWNIYLAAPSGKAADRMCESISKNLNELTEIAKEENAAIFERIKNLESFTIHRLLKYSVKTGTFSMNEKNPFENNSIFVVDEASMIDINLFAAFLSAIPENAKIFILGDPFQLPSVDAGAVLGEILNSNSDDFVVKLKISNRFTGNSKIGQLASFIKAHALKENVSPLDIDFKPFLHLTEPLQENSVNYFDISKDNELKKEEDTIKTLVEEWVKSLKEIQRLAPKVHPLKENPNEDELIARQKIWNVSLSKRMLSAENKGTFGIKNLNKIACDQLRGDFYLKYFPGEFLIITKNQSMYKLYNGDSGIVILERDIPYLMLKKSGSNDFLFYPLSLIPEDALEEAFAITVHKAQGSEYENILMFLPNTLGHPLLTNQILYTGITRAKNSLTLIANQKTFEAACNTITVRETGIEI